MLKIILAFAFIIALSPFSASASDYIKTYVPNYETVGQGRLSVMMFDVYDATLFAPQGQWQAGQPMALQLQYLRNLKGSKIADRSVEEMRNIGINDEVKLAAWHTQMRRIFPDVSEGTTLTGILSNKQESVFYRDGQEIGRIKDPDFGAAFFGIWLSENTSVPELRLSLLGKP